MSITGSPLTDYIIWLIRAPIERIREGLTDEQKALWKAKRLNDEALDEYLDREREKRGVV